METAKQAGKNEVEVLVLYVPTSRSVKFTIDKNATLQQLFDKAYTDLGESKRPGDQYFCQNGVILTNELSRTVEAAISGLCKGTNFEIRNQSGGAST
jgi:hypothetical protein